MCNDYKLKITVMSNKPSDQALKIFQKKLYQLQISNEQNKMSHTVEGVKSVKP